MVVKSSSNGEARKLIREIAPEKRWKSQLPNHVDHSMGLIQTDISKFGGGMAAHILPLRVVSADHTREEGLISNVEITMAAKASISKVAK